MSLCKKQMPLRRRSSRARGYQSTRRLLCSYFSPLPPAQLVNCMVEYSRRGSWFRPSLSCARVSPHVPPEHRQPKRLPHGEFRDRVAFSPVRDRFLILRRPLSRPPLSGIALPFLFRIALSLEMFSKKVKFFITVASIKSVRGLFMSQSVA